MKGKMTDAQIEQEIQRLRGSEYVQLARKEEQMRNRRRQYMYTLRCKEKRGMQLAAAGVTAELLDEMYNG